MKYLIDESVLLELVRYLVSSRSYEEIAPLLAKLTQGLSEADKQELVAELKADGTIASDEEKH